MSRSFMRLSRRTAHPRAAHTLVALLLSLTLLAVDARAQTTVALPTTTVARDTLVVKTYNLSAYEPKLDGQWQGMRIASDGNVYFASSSHSHDTGASIFRYNPDTGELTRLVDDITKALGEDAAQGSPQGKLHSDFIEANGRIYFTTHFAYDADNYPGGHLVALDMTSGELQDYGIIRERYTCYSALGIDAERNLAYVFVTPFARSDRAVDGSHIYRIDLTTGEKTHLGQIGERDYAHCFWMLVDSKGQCWFTVSGADDTLFRARHDRDTLERFENVLPARFHEASPTTVDEPDGRKWWRWAQPLDQDRLVFTYKDGGGLHIFDAAKAPAAADSNADAWADAFTFVAHIGPTGLGMALGGDRVYYVQRANRTAGPKSNNGDHHLLSVNLPEAGEPTIIDHGRITDADGRNPWRLEGLDADANGNLYMTGDWRMVEGDVTTSRFHRLNPDTGEAQYRTLWRAQMFSVVDLTADVDSN